MSGYPEDISARGLCYIEGHLWEGGQCVRCYEQFRCLCGRFMKIEDMKDHESECPAICKFDAR